MSVFAIIVVVLMAIVVSAQLYIRWESVRAASAFERWYLSAASLTVVAASFMGEVDLVSVWLLVVSLMTEGAHLKSSIRKLGGAA